MLAAFGTGPAFSQDVLPFPPPPMGGKVRPSMQESVHKWREAPRRLPEDAPNILNIMLDDAGFGHPGTFSGDIKTPTLTRLANEGNSVPIITADWENRSGDEWLVPLGAGVGKILRLGKLPVNAQLGVYYNVVTPDNGPDWQLRVQVQFLFPK